MKFSWKVFGLGQKPDFEDDDGSGLGPTKLSSDFTAHHSIASQYVGTGCTARIMAEVCDYRGCFGWTQLDSIGQLL